MQGSKPLSAITITGSIIRPDNHRTTDDPAVPAAIKEVFGGVKSDDQGNVSFTGKITFNDQKINSKPFGYKIPEGRKVGNVWEAT